MEGDGAEAMVQPHGTARSEHFSRCLYHLKSINMLQVNQNLTLSIYPNIYIYIHIMSYNYPRSPKTIDYYILTG